MIINGQTANADEVLAGYGSPLAQLAYEQVKSDSTNWTNTDYLGADIFTDSNGAKNTVDAGTSTAYFDTNCYKSIINTDNSSIITYNPNSISNNPENFFDNNSVTYAEENDTAISDGDRIQFTKTLGKTFSSRYINYVKIKAYANVSNNYDDYSTSIKLFTYDGSSWSEHATLATASGDSSNNVTISYNDVYTLGETVEGIAIQIYADTTAGDTASGATIYGKWYVFELFEGSLNTTVETNTIIDEVVPDTIVVYGKCDLPTDTSITVDVSDDGGTSFTSTGNSLNTAIDTSSFTTGNLALKFNLATTDTSVTPKLYGYGVAITDI